MLLAHLQAFLIPILLGIKSRSRFKQIRTPKLIPFAFISLGLASMFEMFDHTTTDWIYVNHSSLLNWLFYSFLSIGLSFFTISVTKNRSIIFTNILLLIAAISFYWIMGKSTTLLLQVLISILLISQWWRRFKDWLFIIYPITGVIFTSFFGIILSSSDKQVWHLFIGPCGTVSVLVFYEVLKRSRNKEIISA